MFDINKFEYIEEKHMGFYEGVYVPSCTELLGVIYPISKDISESFRKCQPKGNRTARLH